jgi:hypothetical protein
MGTEEIWIPLALSALSAGVGVYNQRTTANKQDAALAAQIRNQMATQRKADTQVQQLIGKEKGFTPAPEQAAESQAMNAVRAANAPAATSALDVPGAVSKSYEADRSNAALGITNFGKQQANLMAAMDAPKQARLDFQKNINDYTTGMGMLKRQLQGQDYLSQMKLNSIRPNPWLTGAQGVLQGMASASAAGGWGGGGGGVNTMANDFSGSMPGEWSGNPVDPWSMSGLDKAPFSYMNPPSYP